MLLKTTIAHAFHFCNHYLQIYNLSYNIILVIRFCGNGRSNDGKAMITKPAMHRVQNIGEQMANVYAIDELRGDVSAYCTLLQLQNDAVEDDDLSLASSIGKSMRALREKHDPAKWMHEFHRQDTANDF